MESKEQCDIHNMLDVQMVRKNMIPEDKVVVVQDIRTIKIGRFENVRKRITVF